MQKELGDFTIVSADEGFAKKARKLADRLNAPLAIVEKRRLGNNGMTEAKNVIGSVEGKHALIVDEEIDTRRFALAGCACRPRARRSRYLLLRLPRHLPGPAVERLSNSPIKEIIVTDSIPLPEHKRIPNMTVLSIAELFAGAISRIHDGRSVTELFR